MDLRTGGGLLSRGTQRVWVAPRRRRRRRKKKKKDGKAHERQVTSAWLHWDFTVGIFWEVEFTTSPAPTVTSAGNNLPRLTKTFSVTLNLSTPHNEGREVMKAAALDALTLHVEWRWVDVSYFGGWVTHIVPVEVFPWDRCIDLHKKKLGEAV